MTIRGLLTALVLAPVLLTPSASAQERTPSPQELWEAYPANPGGEPTVPPDDNGTATERGSSDAATGSAAEPGGASGRDAASDGGSSLVPVPVTGAIAALALLGAFVLWRRHRVRHGLAGGLALRYRDRPGVIVAAEPPPPPPPPPPPAPPAPAPTPRRIDWRNYPQPARPAPPAPPPPAPQVRFPSQFEREPTQ